MRVLWVDSPDNPNYDKARAHGIDGFLFDPREPRITKAYLRDVASRSYKVGIYIGANWGELGDTPTSYVAAADAWTRPLRSTTTSPRVQWDLEMHDLDFVLEVFRLWRNVYPWQATSWTCEGMQGGLMSPAFVQAVIGCRIRVSPQFFTGNMTPLGFYPALVDVLARGFPYSSVSPTWDAANLPSYWDGFAFTQQRLP